LKTSRLPTTLPPEGAGAWAIDIPTISEVDCLRCCRKDADDFELAATAVIPQGVEFMPTSKIILSEFSRLSDAEKQRRIQELEDAVRQPMNGNLERIEAEIADLAALSRKPSASE
jgi:hypothetical protein